MKTLKLIAVIAMGVAFLAGMPTVAKATAFEFSPTGATGPGNDIPKNGTGIGGGNGASPSDNFFRLQNAVAGYDTVHPGALPTPTNPPDTLLNMAQGGTTIDVTGFSYAVLHYGVGTNGVMASGGGVEFFFFNGMPTFTIPADGTGLNGFGGFSGGDLFGPGPGTQVPDGGTTVALLGIALGGLEGLRRLMRRKA